MLADIVKARRLARQLNLDEVRDVSHLFYSAHSSLPTLLGELDRLCVSSRKGDRQRAGRLLEYILFLAFSNLYGHAGVCALSTPTSQIDLFVEGDGEDWAYLCELVHLSGNKRKFLVEAKAWKKPIGDPQFRRLCSLLSHHFPNTVGLGIFVSLKGASGFSTKKGKAAGIALRHCRLSQALFYAAENTPVIVLTREDLDAMTSAGGLVELLCTKVSEVEHMRPVLTDPGKPKDVPIPAHLATPWVCGEEEE